MLSQANHWMQIIGSAIDALLLLRVLQLRLNRTYLFITLACILSLFFDGVALWLGPETQESGRVFIYSRFLYVFVFPAAASDVWEEVKGKLGVLRRVATIRLISSVTLAAIFGLVIAAFSQSDEAGSQTLVTTFAVILWAASTTASLAFLWSMHRITKAQQIVLPNNTFVWLIFWGFSLLGEVIYCFSLLASSLYSTTAVDVLALLIAAYESVLALWCIWKLRAIPSDVSPASEKASI